MVPPYTLYSSLEIMLLGENTSIIRYSIEQRHTENHYGLIDFYRCHIMDMHLYYGTVHEPIHCKLLNRLTFILVFLYIFLLPSYNYQWRKQQYKHPQGKPAFGSNKNKNRHLCAVPNFCYIFFLFLGNSAENATYNRKCSL